MPVHCLWDALRKRRLLEEAKNGEELRRLLQGKRVAVDLSIWVIEGQERSLQIEARGGRIWPNYYLLLCFFRAVQFLRYGCFPLGVMEGACPASKERCRERGGTHDQHNEQVSLLFRALGCPVLLAQGEAEGLCAQLSKQGAVDLVCSADSDVFAFGADGLVLKTTKSSGAWQYVRVWKVHEAFGFGQHGFIALALLAGCDFTRGFRGVGAEKSLQCVRGLLRQCDEPSLKERLLEALSCDIPTEWQQLACVRGCRTCRKCGHGPSRKEHGSKGRKDCGTTIGCLPRGTPCPCDFHARHDEVVLARALCSSGMAAEHAKAAWEIYAAPEPAMPTLCWSRPCVTDVVHQLRESCNYPRSRVLRNLLPALMLWDLTHQGDAMLVPVSVVGLCKKQRPVFDWAVRPFDEDMMEALRCLPREHRSVPRDLAARFCPEIMTRFGIDVLIKKIDSCPRRHRNREYWQTEALNLFEDLGLPVPSEVDETLKDREGMWRQRARCRKQLAQHGNQLTMDAFIIKPVVSFDEHLAAGVDLPGAATCVLSPPNKRKRWAVDFDKNIPCMRVIIFAARGP